MNHIILNIAGGLIDSALNIIRISLGNLNYLNSKYILFKLFKSNIKEKLYYIKNIYFNNYILDESVIIFYKKPFSYTGENLIELIIHGNYINCKNIVLKLKFYLNEFKVKFSKPGEFSKRSYKNKKLNLLKLKKVFYKLNNNKIISLNLKKKILNLKFLINYIKYLKFNRIKINFSFKKKFIYFYKFFFNILYILKWNYKLNFYLCGQFNTGKSSIINKLFKKKFSVVSNFKGSTKNIFSYKFFIYKKFINIFDTVGFYNSFNVFEKFFIKKFLKNLKFSNIIIFIYSSLKIFNIFFYKINFKKILYIFNKIDLYFFNIPSFELKIYKKFIILYKISCKRNLGICFIIYYLKKIIYFFNNFINFNFNNIKIIKKINNLIFKIIINKKNFFYKILKLNNYINLILNFKFKKNINKFFKNFCIGK